MVVVVAVYGRVTVTSSSTHKISLTVSPVVKYWVLKKSSAGTAAADTSGAAVVAGEGVAAGAGDGDGVEVGSVKEELSAAAKTAPGASLPEGAALGVGVGVGSAEETAATDTATLASEPESESDAPDLAYAGPAFMATSPGRMLTGPTTLSLLRAAGSVMLQLS